MEFSDALSDAGDVLAFVNERIEALRGDDRVIAAAQARQAERLAELASITVSPVAQTVFGGRELADRAITMEVAAARGMSERTVAREMSLAVQLCEDLPEVHEALEFGEISIAHAKVIAAETTGLAQEDAILLALLALRDLPGQAPGRYGSRIRKLRERRYPEQAAERRRRAVADRTVWVEPERDGMAWLHALLTAEDATAIYGRLDDGAKALRTEGAAQTVAAGIMRTRADLLAALLLGDISGRRGQLRGCMARIRPTVLVSIPADTLLGGTTPAELVDYGPIDAETARHLAAGAHELRALITEPRTGAPIRLGRKRTVTKAMRDFLRVRDGRCMAPCCNRSTRGADMDHLEDWARGGQTVPENLATECRGHHLLKTAGIIHPTHPPGTPDGTIRWQTKLGRVYLEAPTPFRAERSPPARLAK